MKKIKYTGNADERQITSDDFDSVGVSSKDVTWRNGEVVEVANDAADWLLDNLPGEFEHAPDDSVGLADEDELPPNVARTTTAGTAGEGGAEAGEGAGSIGAITGTRTTTGTATGTTGTAAGRGGRT